MKAENNKMVTEVTTRAMCYMVTLSAHDKLVMVKRLVMMVEMTPEKEAVSSKEEVDEFYEQMTAAEPSIRRAISAMNLANALANALAKAMSPQEPTPSTKV